MHRFVKTVDFLLVLKPSSIFLQGSRGVNLGIPLDLLRLKLGYKTVIIISGYSLVNNYVVRLSFVTLLHNGDIEINFVA